MYQVNSLSFLMFEHIISLAHTLLINAWYRIVPFIYLNIQYIIYLLYIIYYIIYLYHIFI